jgi:hypothetical protein
MKWLACVFCLALLFDLNLAQDHFMLLSLEEMLRCGYISTQNNQNEHQESRVGEAELVMVFTQISSSLGDHTFYGSLTHHFTQQKIASLLRPRPYLFSHQALDRA